jgi:hypothetical protein
MSDVSFKRHFALLLFAALVLTLWFEPIVNAIPIGRPFSSLGVYGLLHASAWVLAVRKASLLRRLSFVAVATGLGMAVFFSPVILYPVADIVRGTDPFVTIWGSASAVGACVYWVAMRAFWLPQLRVWSLVQTVLMCVIATFVTLKSGGEQDLSATSLSDVPPVDFLTLFWWFAFSSSIFISNRVWPVGSRWLRSRPLLEGRM